MFLEKTLLRGTGERLRGDIQLSENDRWDLPVPRPDAHSILQLVLGGDIDIDGDGSQDILTGSLASDPFSPTGSVYLIPSTPRAPD